MITDSLCRRAVVATLLLFISTLGASMPASALSQPKDDTIGVRDWLVVPVFYATNRQYTGKDGSIIYSDEPNNTGLLFGVKNIVVPAPPTASVAASKLEQMAWQSLHTAEAGKLPVVMLDKCPLKDHVLAKDEVVQAFQSYSASTGSHDSVVFVHGCCATFDTSMTRAAKIAAHMGTPILLYDWVSPVGFDKYLQNETRVKQTTDDFCRFLGKLDKVTDPSTITLLGHSVGNEFIDQAMVRRSIANSFIPLKPYREIIMSNADIDARTFLKHPAEIAGNGSIVRVYISRKDDRLDASSLVHGGFERLGAPGPLLNEVAQAKGITVVDITDADTGHEIPFPVVAAFHANNPAALNPLFKIERREPGYFCLTRLVAPKNKVQDSAEKKNQTASCSGCY
jgi:esterase/lipase superfamily enzyme